MKSRALLVFTYSLCCATPALADDGVFNLVFENDAFANTDRHYTSGILFDYVGARNDASSRTSRWARRLPQVEQGDDIYLGFHLGHQIFTPDNTRTTELMEDERPYAGYLYGGFSLTAANPREMNTWKVSVGVVGPKARAEEFQTSIHNRLGVNVARGWDHQLADETVLQFDYHKSWRQVWTYSRNNFGFDLMPYSGFALGNAFVHADLGFSLRFGRGLGTDFGPPRMQPSLPGSNFFRTHNGGGWYLFAGLGGRYVGRNIFLDGNTHEQSHSVDKVEWVGDLQAGFVVNSPSYRLAYTFVARSREFEGQEVGDKFGSMTLSFKF
ncbi:lipid A deacylase LpxR family protein [Gilvimarinus sp. F26214L]|uniref:lipid A deacylase LpxR family protein n=1 Tax=Gilvimarinus sp. DZF01 TaxID=3461371 RepID=UPI0040461557